MNKKILFKVNIDVKSAKISTTILFAFLKSMFPCTRPCGYLYSHVSLTFYDVFDIKLKKFYIKYYKRETYE